MLNNSMFWTTTTPSSLLTNLIGYWKLDELSLGSLADDAHSTNDGSIGTALVCGSTGKIGTSIVFTNTSNSFVTLPHNTDTLMGTSDFSMCAWVNPISHTASWRGIIGGDSSAFIYGTFGTSGALAAAKNNVAGTDLTTLLIPLNQWSFTAIVFDSVATTNNITFYLNASTAQIQSFNYNFDTGHTNLIGGVGTANPFNGKIDEVGIWKRKLTAAEIASLYNGGNGLAYSFR